MENIINRFIRYAKIDTQSDETSNTIPSTLKQLDLLNLLVEELKEYGYKPCVMHLTTPLYSYAENYFEWNENSDEKPREFLQKMGVEIIKEKLGKKTFLLDRLAEDIEILSEFFDTFIIVDARLKKEFDYLTSKYQDVVTIKLERENYESGLSETEKSHITENDLDDYQSFDYLVNNNGIIGLKEKAKELIKKEEGESNE